MYRPLLALSCVLFLGSSALAQVVYEPVRYQHGTEHNRYFYGGTNPAVHAMAGYDRCPRYHYGGINLHLFDGGTTFNQPSPMYRRTPVFSDCVGYFDASWFGYTQADARNEAYSNTPTYFRKADLLANAVVTPDGTRVVPALAPKVHVAPPPVYVPHYPGRGQIIIIPKNLLDRPLKDFEPRKKSVASAGN